MGLITATATKVTRIAVCQILFGKVSPIVVSDLTNRPALYVCCENHHGSLEEMFAPLVEEIHSQQSKLD